MVELGLPLKGASNSCTPLHTSFSEGLGQQASFLYPCYAYNWNENNTCDSSEHEITLFHRSWIRFRDKCHNQIIPRLNFLQKWTNHVTWQTAWICWSVSVTVGRQPQSPFPSPDRHIIGASVARNRFKIKLNFSDSLSSCLTLTQVVDLGHGGWLVTALVLYLGHGEVNNPTTNTQVNNLTV